LSARIRSVPHDRAAKSRFSARDGCPQRIDLRDSARPAAETAAECGSTVVVFRYEDKY
jgi:hypothetical protein